MPDYEKMYHKTFNALTDAEEIIQRAGQLLIRANAVIMAAQQQCEELYVNAKEEKEPDA